MPTQTQVIGIFSIILSVCALFYVFNSILTLSDKCKVGENLSICSKLSGLTLPAILILLTIAGLGIVISITVYVILSAS